MENVNPYDPPMPSSSEADPETSYTGNGITATFLFSPDHLIETFARYRSQVIFSDGVLIFQEPKVAHWIPDSALEQGGDAMSLRNLVKANLPTNQAE